MHDLILAGRLALKREALPEDARELGLEMARFEADLKSEALAAAVEVEKKCGTAVGVGGMPTLFLNGNLFVFEPEISRVARGKRDPIRLGTMLAEDRLLRGGPGKPTVLEAFVRFTGSGADASLRTADPGWPDPDSRRVEPEPGALLARPGNRSVRRPILCAIISPMNVSRSIPANFAASASVSLRS